MESGRANNISTSVIRCGLMYGEQSIFLQKLVEYLYKGKIPIVGEGRNKLSLIHTEDAASAFVTMAEEQYNNPSLASIYHLIDDHPKEINQILQEVASDIGATQPFTVPLWIAKMSVSSDIIDFLTSSTVTSNAKLKRNFNWKPKYGSLRDGLIQVLQNWKNSNYSYK